MILLYGSRFSKNDLEVKQAVLSNRASAVPKNPLETGWNRVRAGPIPCSHGHEAGARATQEMRAGALRFAVIGELLCCSAMVG